MEQEKLDKRLRKLGKRAERLRHMHHAKKDASDAFDEARTELLLRVDELRKLDAAAVDQRLLEHGVNVTTAVREGSPNWRSIAETLAGLMAADDWMTALADHDVDPRSFLGSDREITTVRVSA